jgi:hypothetical protein
MLVFRFFPFAPFGVSRKAAAKIKLFFSLFLIFFALFESFFSSPLFQCFKSFQIFFTCRLILFTLSINFLTLYFQNVLAFLCIPFGNGCKSRLFISFSKSFFPSFMLKYMKPLEHNQKHSLIIPIFIRAEL